MIANPAGIALSLISHTNAGKTTLARTLLGRDVGDVRDAPHVTTETASYPLIESSDGDALVLWDTPGFADSARLAKRLAQQGSPIGWFLSQVWDRFRDRSFWLTQLAVRNVRDQADVVLYLVNASEDPGDAGYLKPELAVLEWMRKPVLVLLNQTGVPRPAAVEAADVTRWRDALRPQEHVLALDAFARCWVQELALFDRIGEVLADVKRPAFARLAAAWQARRWAQFTEAMTVLAAPIAAAACARVVVPAVPMLKRLGEAIGVKREEGDGAQARALRTLARQLDDDLRASADRLLALHGLGGRAGADIAARLASDVVTDAPLDEGKAAAIGGIVSGALSGLAADLAAGGLTFGAGMLTGALVGALGGAGIAHGVNLARGDIEAGVRWDNAFLDGLVASALLRYLAVAHYGRGRGDWKESEYPAFWRERVGAAVTAHRATLTTIWSMRGPACEPAGMAQRLEKELGAIARALLRDLYPQTFQPPPASNPPPTSSCAL
jgi:hypothetical protein